MRSVQEPKSAQEPRPVQEPRSAQGQRIQYTEVLAASGYYPGAFLDPGNFIGHSRSGSWYTVTNGGRTAPDGIGMRPAAFIGKTVAAFIGRRAADGVSG